MFQSNEIAATKISTTDAVSATLASTVKSQTVIATSSSATKDAGRVHIGGGMMRFGATKDAGRVHVGGGMMRF